MGGGKTEKNANTSSEQSQKDALAPWKCFKEEEMINCVETCWKTIHANIIRKHGVMQNPLLFLMRKA